MKLLGPGSLVSSQLSLVAALTGLPMIAPFEIVATEPTVLLKLEDVVAETADKLNIPPDEVQGWMVEQLRALCKQSPVAIPRVWRATVLVLLSLHGLLF